MRTQTSGISAPARGERQSTYGRLEAKYDRADEVPEQQCLELLLV